MKAEPMFFAAPHGRRHLLIAARPVAMMVAGLGLSLHIISLFSDVPSHLRAKILTLMSANGRNRNDPHLFPFLLSHWLGRRGGRCNVVAGFSNMAVEGLLSDYCDHRDHATLEYLETWLLGKDAKGLPIIVCKKCVEARKPALQEKRK